MSNADGKATRRRGAALENVIFEAVWEELADAGWSGFQMSRVAKRAQASTAIIYRRWPDRAALVTATLNAKKVSYRAETVTGDLRADLLALLRRQVELYRTPFGAASRGLLSHVSIDSDLRFDPVPVGSVLDVLTASGEIPAPQRLPRAVVNVGTDLVSHYFLATGAGQTDPDLEEIVDLIWLPAIRRSVQGVPPSSSPRP
jgi:AcrR family transcriptional regulator